MSQIYNCPDCHMKDKPYFGNPCDSCGRVTRQIYNPYFSDTVYKIIKYNKPDSCDNCSNNPINGDSKSCCLKNWKNYKKKNFMLKKINFKGVD